MVSCGRSNTGGCAGSHRGVSGGTGVVVVVVVVVIFVGGGSSGLGIQPYINPDRVPHDRAAHRTH